MNLLQEGYDSQFTCGRSEDAQSLIDPVPLDGIADIGRREF